MKDIDKELSTILRKVVLFDEKDKLETELIENIKQLFKESVPLDGLVMPNFAEVKEVLNETEKFINWLNEIIVFPEYLQSTYANSYMNLAHRIAELKSKISA